MTIKTTKIPQRQKCVDKEHPYIGGATDVYDDDLSLTQAQINAIVLGGSISQNLTVNRTAIFVGVIESVRLTATINTPADTIKIFKNGTAQPIATGSGKSLIYVDNPYLSERGNVQYYAEFTIGGLVKRQPASGFVNVPVVDCVYTGAGTTYNSETLLSDTTPHAAGSFNRQITTADGDYLFIEVPDNFNLTHIVLVSTYETGLEFTQIESTRSGYKAYKNNVPRGAGTYTYKFTIANA